MAGAGGICDDLAEGEGAAEKVCVLSDVTVSLGGDFSICDPGLRRGDG